MKNLFIKKFILLTLLALSGCASIPASRYNLLNYDKKIKSTNEMREWQVIGKVSVTQNKTSNSANFHWLQKNKQLNIKFMNSLGFGSAILTNNAGMYTLTVSNGEVVKSNYPDKILEEHIGIGLPIISLNYWTRGLPDKKNPIISQERDANGLLKSLKQGNWEIKYGSYRNYNGIHLPSKITIVNPIIKIKIVISNWYN